MVEGYGLTEASPVVSINPVRGPKLGTVGLPVPSTEVAIRDDAGHDLPAGEAGEVCVRGPQVMQGYWQRPDETKLVLADGWLRTGDIGTLDAGGYLRILDRKKDMINVSGFKVFPNEVEDVIMQHPGVLEAAAIGIADERSGQTVKLFVVKRDPALTADGSDEIRARQARRLQAAARDRVRRRAAEEQCRQDLAQGVEVKLGHFVTCERSEAIQSGCRVSLDCFVAALLAMTSPSMRHQHRKLGVGEDVARGAAEDHLAQPALGVGAFDEEVAAEFGGLVQQNFAGACACRRRSVMQVAAMPFCASERAICSPLGPATVAPSTVQMVTRSARRRSGMANAVARACSVLQFQAIMTLVASVGGEVGEAIRIGRPLSNNADSSVTMDGLCHSSPGRARTMMSNTRP